MNDQNPKYARTEDAADRFLPRHARSEARCAYDALLYGQSVSTDTWNRILALKEILDNALDAIDAYRAREATDAKLASGAIHDLRALGLGDAAIAVQLGAAASLIAAGASVPLMQRFASIAASGRLTVDDVEALKKLGVKPEFAALTWQGGPSSKQPRARDGIPTRAEIESAAVAITRIKGYAGPQGRAAETLTRAAFEYLRLLESTPRLSLSNLEAIGITEPEPTLEDDLAALEAIHDRIAKRAEEANAERERLGQLAHDAQTRFDRFAEETSNVVVARNRISRALDALRLTDGTKK